MHALEKELATHSSVLAWRLPGTEEPGVLPSMGLHRVRHDESDLAAAAATCFPHILASRGQEGITFPCPSAATKTVHSLEATPGSLAICHGTDSGR